MPLHKSINFLKEQRESIFRFIISYSTYLGLNRIAIDFCIEKILLLRCEQFQEGFLNPLSLSLSQSEISMMLNVINKLIRKSQKF